jgi:hypothetical protein
MWTISEIVSAISGENGSLNRVGQITLGLWDSELNIGVGRSPQGSQVLVLPGQPNVAAFKKKFGKYDPFYKAQVIGEEEVQGNFAILDCQFDMSDGFQLSTLAGVFSGLIDVQLTFGDSGVSIWSMKKLFDHGLSAPDDQNLTGLIGELAVVCTSKNKSAAVDAWHSSLDSVYDFSFSNNRIEVKTSKTLLRRHFFSSHQLPPVTDVNLKIASVLVPIVETGANLLDLYNLCVEGLPLDKSEKVLKQVIDTVGVPPAAVSGIVFDLVGLLGSVKYFDNADIPIPSAPSGVLSMKWESDLEGLTEGQSYLL